MTPALSPDGEAVAYVHFRLTAAPDDVVLSATDACIASTARTKSCSPTHPWELRNSADLDQARALGPARTEQKAACA